MVEFLLWKLGIGAAFAFVHGLVYTLVTGRPLEAEQSDTAAGQTGPTKEG